MDKNQLLELVSNFGVVPVIAIESVEAALPLADALAEGGLPVAEITFRTAAAGEVISKIGRERPAILLGAGTVLTPENLLGAAKSGARFGVAPGLNPDVVNEAHRVGLPFIPGVLTPSEVERAYALGALILKFFPSEASGGLSMIKALAAPYMHLGIRFMPTGGVSPDNLEQYLKSEAVACVGGTWIASREAISGGKWTQIVDNCRRAVEIVKRTRG
ncbi:MAG TPA: bifunctional 4-hydroxy-2-oxoglutarate aldolase/2-dehydro-3-deoxy-phosphogluconate aldolase [Anaerolineales bacterium]|nr:bifunctional 4-hydroxy-2-oxoglutarate aldolase/2-dehydro-3-deoxy-phosphogluconate aldolase [Anaerolineales bacterium]